MQALELKVPPPLVALILGAAMWALSLRTQAIALDAFARAFAGGAVALLGGGVSLAGIIGFSRAKTTVSPHKPENTSALVTAGIYRFTRNPMYVGVLLVLAGWAVFLAVPWAIAGPLVFFLYIDRFQIAPEERVLSSMFGEEYAKYRATVRRWV